MDSLRSAPPPPVRTPPVQTALVGPVVRPNPLRSTASGAAGMVLVGGSVGVSELLTAAPLFTAQAIRYAAAALILLGMARIAGVRIRRPRGVDWAWLAGVAVVGLVVFNVAVVRGVAHAEPAVIAVAVACVPIVLGIAGPLLEGHRPRARVLIAGLAVTAGSWLVVGGGRTDATGIAWAAVALACECGFTLLAVPVLRRHGAWTVSVHTVWMGALLYALLGLALEGPRAALGLTPADWLAVGYLAVGVTAIAFVLWYSSVGALGAGRVGLLTGVAPIAAALIGILTTGAGPGPVAWAGIGLVIAALAAGLSGRPGPVS